MHVRTLKTSFSSQYFCQRGSISSCAYRTGPTPPPPPPSPPPFFVPVDAAVSAAAATEADSGRVHKASGGRKGRVLLRVGSRKPAARRRPVLKVAAWEPLCARARRRTMAVVARRQLCEGETKGAAAVAVPARRGRLIMDDDCSDWLRAGGERLGSGSEPEVGA